MQTTRQMLVLAGLTALMLALAPLGWAQMEDESSDAYSDANDAGTMPSGGMGSMGHMGGQMGGHMEGMSPMGGESLGGMMAHMSTENLKQRLGLTDDQAAKLKELRSNYLKTTTMQGAKIHVAELELNDLLDEKKLDASKIEKKVKEIESLKSELLMGRIRSLINAADFLSPEQFARFRAMTMQRMRPMGRLQKHPMGPHSGAGPMSGQIPGTMMPRQ
jgi:Spy/CpxP family protein refolding chaperone